VAILKLLEVGIAACNCFLYCRSAELFSKIEFSNRGAPLDQYLIADENSEIALARTGAATSISGNAEVEPNAKRNEKGQHVLGSLYSNAS
jgi:hypothetical protein